MTVLCLGRYHAKLPAQPHRTAFNYLRSDEFTLLSATSRLRGGPTLPMAVPSDSLPPAHAAVGPARGFGRLQHRYRVVDTHENPRQEKHELVLDVDDLVVAVVPEHGSGIFPIGHALGGVLVGLGVAASAWFGFIASVREMGDAWRITKHLAAERAYIESVMPNPPRNKWDIKQLRTAHAMLHRNSIDRREQRLRFIFSGGLVTVASSIEIAGYMTTPFLLGGVSPAVAAASSPLLAAAVPLISLFALGNAGMQFARWRRAYSDRQFVDSVAAQNPWPREQFDAHDFVHKRLRLIRHQALATAVGFSAIALGAPLTFFGGPYGLAFLVPGVLTVAIANHFESTKVEYKNPLSLKQSLGRVTERQICNEMGLAYLEYRALKMLKRERRSRYLVGSHRGPVMRALTAPLRQLLRLTQPVHDNGESSLQTLYRFFGHRLQLLQAYWQAEIVEYRRNLERDDSELIDLLQKAQAQARRVAEDYERWQQEVATLRTLAPEVATARLCDTLIEFELFDDFVVNAADHPRLRRLLGIKRNRRVTIAAQAVIAAVEAAGDQEPEVVEEFFEVAEVLFLTTVKDWRHSRAREMADLAVERVRDKNEVAGPVPDDADDP